MYLKCGLLHGSALNLVRIRASNLSCGLHAQGLAAFWIYSNAQLLVLCGVGYLVRLQVFLPTQALFTAVSYRNIRAMCLGTFPQGTLSDPVCESLYQPAPPGSAIWTVLRALAGPIISRVVDLLILCSSACLLTTMQAVSYFHN